MTFEMAMFIEWLKEPYPDGIPYGYLHRTGDTNSDHFNLASIDVAWQAFKAGYEHGENNA